MRLLFVKLKHIGDSLLLTPALDAARATYPAAQIWVVVRKGSEGILSGCAAIDCLLTAAAPEPRRRERFRWWQDAQLLGRLRRQRFDYAFEFGSGDRGRFLAGLSGAHCRAANKRHDFPLFWRFFFNCLSDFDDTLMHQVERDYRLVSEHLRLPPEIPALKYDRAVADFRFVNENQLSNYIVAHPATRWQRKQWPQARWIELLRILNRRGFKLVLSCGPEAAEVEQCRKLQEESGIDAMLTNGSLNWPQMAGLAYGAVLFIGVDTAAMHLAAACGTPIVALFGPSLEDNWRPWQSPSRVVAPPIYQDFSGWYERVVRMRNRRMEDIPLEAVLAACNEMLECRPGWSI